MSENVIVESVSPDGLRGAWVEDDGRCVYLYVRGGPDSDVPMRDCWVRNRVRAPAKLDVDGMQKGVPPLLPAPFCAHPDGASALNAEELRLIWFEDCCGVGLFEGDQLLAVIPSWTERNGVSGFARDCIDESSICRPLRPNARTQFLQELRLSEAAWESWEQDPWTPYQEASLQEITSRFGQYSNYYAIDGGQWPPKAMVRTPTPGGVTLLTIGVGLRPQPIVAAGSPFRRIELGFGIDDETNVRHGINLMRYLSGQSSLPWSAATWLGDGHTIPCDALPGFTAILLRAAPPAAPSLTWPMVRNERVSTLWIVPLTEQERQFAMERSSAELAQRLDSAGVHWMFRQRKELSTLT